MALFRSFKINKLFGYKDVDIEFKNDFMILIGENGSGKTTILNSIYYIIAKQFDELSKIEFESIEIVWGRTGRKWRIDQWDLHAKRLGNIGIRDRQLITQLQDILKLQDFNNLAKIIQSKEEYETKTEECFNYLQKKGLRTKANRIYLYECTMRLVNDLVAYMFEEKVAEMESYVKDTVLFLPTYRRVERQIEERENPETNSLLGIHYGMNDVEDIIRKLKGQIDQLNKDGFSDMTINLLSKFTGLQQQRVGFNLPSDKIELVLNRLGDKLPIEHKNSIISYLAGQEHDNEFIEAIVDELYKIYEKQEYLDLAIKTFVNRCNTYLQNKKFIYDESQVEIIIKSIESDSIISLDMLSSGEKQMVSMLAYLYLRQSDDKFIVLIDEPELSLSIKWQEQLLLDFANSKKCSFMIAVTHSPFIFNNNMKQYAVGLHNFVNNANK